jgi:hypothetical protein
VGERSSFHRTPGVTQLQYPAGFSSPGFFSSI